MVTGNQLQRFVTDPLQGCRPLFPVKVFLGGRAGDRGHPPQLGLLIIIGFGNPYVLGPQALQSLESDTPLVRQVSRSSGGLEVTQGSTGRCITSLIRSPFWESEASYVHPILPLLTSCTHHGCLGKLSQELSQTQTLPVPLIPSSCRFPLLRCPWGRVFTSRSSGSALVSSKITKGLELSPDSRMDDINRFM